MEARAVGKFVLISPRKARLVADLIKNKRVGEASAILRFTPKKAAEVLGRVLDSAIANAIGKEGSGKLDPDTLFVKNAVIDPGPVMPRWRPTAFGRAARIRKRMSHVRVTVTTEMPRTVEGTKAARKMAAAPKKHGKK